MPKWGGISIGDDLTKTEQDQMRDIRIVAAHAKAVGKKVELKGKTVKIDGKVYVWDNLELLPEGLKLGDAKTLHFTEGIVFQSKHSYLSNMFPVNFTFGDFMYISVEQAYVHQTALEAKAPQVAAKTLMTQDPYEAKKLLKNIATTQEWQDIGRFKLLIQLQLCKFRQDRSLHDRLIQTSPTPLFESTRDPVFGTGYIIQDGVKNCTPKGQNKCGALLCLCSSLCPAH